jgi:Domain of unknown function (DUF4389)
VPYPVTFEMDYVEKRSRLTTFFRLILAIPHFIVLYLYGLAAAIVVIIAWFALLFTGRYPLGMYDFVAGYLRYATRMYGYIWLATDEYPPFSGDPALPYPVRLNIEAPKAEYSRLKVLFRIILAIPIIIINYAMQIVAEVGAFLAWFAIVALGRQPKGLQDMIGLGLSYHQRSSAYFALLTEDWPPFTDDSASRIAPAPSFGSLPPTTQEADASTSGFAEPTATADGPEAPVPPEAVAAPEAPAPPEPPAAPDSPEPPSSPATPPHGDPLSDQPAESDDEAPSRPPEEEDEPPRGPFGPSSS